MPIPADLQQNIFITVYLTILHNFVAIFYFLGLIVTTLWAFYKPSRSLILVIAGFALLLFAFEYSKHLAPVAQEFKDQTFNSIITENPHYKAQRIIDIFFNKMIPIGTPVLGWLLLAAGCIMGLQNRLKVKK